jgi:hypothetical protein
LSDDSAKELADRAGDQAKHAAKNSGRAAKAAAEPVAEAVAEEARDTAHKLEGTADDAVRAARKINVGVLGKMSSDTGVGFLALSLAIYSGAVAYSKFRQAAGRTTVVTD